MFVLDIGSLLQIETMMGSSPVPVTFEEVQHHPVCEVALNVMADLFTRCYTNYYVPMQMDTGALSWILSTQTIDLASSLVIDVAGEHVGFIFISARGLSQRVAAMGVLPEQRGRGYGQYMVELCINNARRQGIHRMVLEVIDRNVHAVSIYRQLGFEVSRGLVGYSRPREPLNRGGDELPDEIDPREVAKAVIHDGAPGLPWQIAPDSLIAMRPPSRAYTLERSAYAIINNVTGTSARLDAILVPRTKRRKGWGSRMLGVLYSQYPDREWSVPAVVPEDLAFEFFIANGFRREQMRQYEMVLRLDETSSRFPYEG